ncbi:group 1 family glycosyl transferase [Caballeronia fortuita]|uniref:Group 1 family glycosyl transferase n=1 Tax=Caballeronia fortuita TaxID=1777138 RepID=A0A158E0X4_9BURK|nr:group 1 family glycosyl transferase [Caballeronia fortuita]
MNIRKVAIVHEWFAVVAGAEQVVRQMLDIFPQADVFFIVAKPDTVERSEFLRGRKVTTSFIQRLPGSGDSYRRYLPLMPMAVEQWDLSEYDIVISSAHAVSKGVLTGPDQLHISYVHSPMRYAWDLQHQYLRESGLTKGLKSMLARWMLHKLRIWDYRTAAGVDHFVANSGFISRRIKKVYGRDAIVIYPPVDVRTFELCTQKDDFYLVASRLVPYKRVDLVVAAFSAMSDKRLVVIGDGPEMNKIKKLAGSNVEILGYQPLSELKRYMQRARAFVFAAEEDFGIAPVEAQACGTPVIAYGKGGSRETVVDTGDERRRTGIWFGQQTVESIIDAVTRFEELPGGISPAVCRAHAEKFSAARFKDEFRSYVDACWAQFNASRDLESVAGARAVRVFYDPSDSRLGEMTLEPR